MMVSLFRYTGALILKRAASAAKNHLTCALGPRHEEVVAVGEKP